MIGALDDLQGPGADPGQASLQFLAAVAPIGEDMTQPGIAMADRAQDLDGPVSILDIGTVDDEPDQMAKRVGDDAALAALDRRGHV